MRFPYNDINWTETAAFLKSHIRDEDIMIVPAEFKEVFDRPGVMDITAVKDARFDWAVIMKDKTAMIRIDHGLLKEITSESRPVFVNRLFAIFSRRQDLPEVEPSGDIVDFRWQTRLVNTFYKTLDLDFYFKDDMYRRGYCKALAKHVFGLPKKRIIEFFRPPVFIHSLWRTGSTYVWNKFRESDDCHAYLEPFNEQLLTGTHQDFEAVFKGNFSDKMSHPSLDRHYFYEYPFANGGGVPLFKKRFSYDDYCLEDNREYPELKRYIEMLIRNAPKRVVMQFCRSTLRAGWLKKNFRSINIYILRPPRCQWESYLVFSHDFGRNYFNCCSMLIAGKNASSILMSPLHEFMAVPYFDSQDIVSEVRFYLDVLHGYSQQELYFVFYYLWLVSMLNAAPLCDIVMDMDLISEDVSVRKSVEGLLRRYSLNIGLHDCSIKRYADFTLSPGEMDKTEKQVQDLVVQRLGHLFKKKAASFKKLFPFVSEEHRKVIGLFID